MFQIAKRAGAFALAAFLSGPALAGDIIGQATVVDGDTIEIHSNRIRLFGIDAPESAQTCQDEAGKVYRCGQAAAIALSDMIGSKTVQCEPRDIDRYGRTVATCRASGTDVAEALVRDGLALDYRQYSKGAYAPAQSAADKTNAGMWRGPFVEPWLYRACLRAGKRPTECSTGSR